jgi:hypothetical protein
MAGIEMNYESLPQLIKDNLSAEQWEQAQYDILHEGVAVPETARFINVRNGQIHEYAAGDRADAPLLPVHDLSGAGGGNSSQFEGTQPRTG